MNYRLTAIKKFIEEVEADTEYDAIILAEGQLIFLRGCLDWKIEEIKE